MKTVTKKLKNKERRSSLLDGVSDNNKISNDNNKKKLKCIITSSSGYNEYKTINSKIINAKIKNEKKKTKQPLSSSLLLMTPLESKENSEFSEEEIIYHEPEIFISTQFESSSSHSYDIAMLKLHENSAESISHKNPSLEEFLDIWDNEWSDEQILSYFSKYLSDPRIIVLDKIYNDNLNIADNIIIPKEIWQIIVQFEFGSAKKQIKRRYYHWISQQRKQIYWIPFILGSAQCFGVFFVLFYVFVSGTSLHDAADIGAADIDDTTNNNNTEITDSVTETNSFGDLIKFYCALMTVIAAVIQIIGALRSYYLAQFRYSEKLKRFKRIIHLQTNNKKNKKNNNNKQEKKNHIELEIEEKKENENNNNDDEDDDDDDNTDDIDIKVRDLPNVEINFDINQVPKEFRHIFLQQKQEEKKRRNDNNIHSQYEDIESDSEDSINSLSIQQDEGGDDDDNDDKEDDDDDDEEEKERERINEKRLRWKQRKRLNYMMGVINDRQQRQKIIDNHHISKNNNNKDDDDEEKGKEEEEEEKDVDDEEEYEYDEEETYNICNNANKSISTETSLEEMQLILSGWESYISFQRWINLSSLVVTDNLSDPYLICFVLHKYFYVLCVSTYVFGQNLTTFESLIPFILLFLSFSYLGLIVLDRISAKRAILYILSMIGCCGIIIGIFAGILFLLSYLFYNDVAASNDDTSIGNIYNNNNTTSIFDEFTTTLIDDDDGGDIGMNDDDSSQSQQQQTWWITDFFYPILAFILCSNTIRRIRNGFENNIPEIKYTLWSNCCFVSLIMTFATNSATWSNAEVKAAFLLIFVYMGYLWAQMRLHQAVTRLKKIDYANKYLTNSKWVKKQLFWSWLGQISNQFE